MGDDGQMKLLLLAALIATPAIPQTTGDAAEATTRENIDPAEFPEVVQVFCRTGPMTGTVGTAFRVSASILLSAAHATTHGDCSIRGEPFKVLETYGDFAILQQDKAAPKWLTIDCGGFVRGKTYRAIGFARGLPTQTEVEVRATGESFHGFSRLWGVFNIIPGQSGGVFLDAETGKAVGVINVYNAERGDSGSIALKDTIICGSAA